MFFLTRANAGSMISSDMIISRMHRKVIIPVQEVQDSMRTSQDLEISSISSAEEDADRAGQEKATIC